MKKIFTPTISSAIESVTNQNLGSPSSLIIHTGTNDLEKSPPEVCFDNFQALIDLTAQKFPHTKIIISSLLVRNDQFDATRSQLNSQLSRLRSYPNVHFVNNENITSTMLHARQKTLKKTQNRTTGLESQGLCLQPDLEAYQSPIEHKTTDAANQSPSTATDGPKCQAFHS